MSVQLILYPQRYDGSYSATTTQQTTQYVADNVWFYGVSSATVYGTGSAVNPTNQAVVNNSATQSWKTFRTSGGTWGTPDAPTGGATGLVLDSASTISQSGVYQIITNLTIGQQYDIKVNLTQAASDGTILLHTSPYTWTDVDGNTRFTTGNLNPITLCTTGIVGSFDMTFTAQHQSEVLVVTYQNDTGAAIKISKISIIENVNAPLVATDLADGQVICDLYKDETIPLSLSVDNFKNAAEKVQSYSKSFNLPATKRNNKIFTHLFDVTTSQDAYSFNPYIKTQAIVKEDSYTIFEGYLRLIEIVDKKGEISYNVNLYSEAISLKETLDSRTFADLDFQELEHNYHRTNIQSSWTNALPVTALTNTWGGFAGTTGATTTGVLKYPFVDWTGNLALDTGTSPNTLELSSLQDAFRPWIQVKYLIDRIFYHAGFDYTCSVFDTANFKRLFMDFNWGEGNQPQLATVNSAIGQYRRHLAGSNNTAGTSYSNLQINYLASSTATTMTTTQGWSTSTNKFTCPQNNTQYQIIYSFEIEFSSPPIGTPAFFCRWVHKDSGGNLAGNGEVELQPFVMLSSASGVSTYAGSFVEVLNANDTLEPQFKKLSGTVSQYNTSATSTGGATAQISVGTGIVNITSSELLNTKRGKMKQWEFLKGIFTMFNLITLQDKENPKHLLIEPYADVFINPSNVGLTSTQHDWTSKVDISQIKLQPLKDLKRKTIFSYEEDKDDYALRIYKNAMGGAYLYGSKIRDNTDLTLLEGEKEITASPFAPTVIKPAIDGFTNDMIIPAIYECEGDDCEEFDNAPRILYDVTHTTTTYIFGGQWKVPAQNGVSGVSNHTTICQFAHVTEVPTTTDTIDYNFGECNLINPVDAGGLPVDNLYNLYWGEYFEELFNVDTRVLKMKVYLTPADINGFNFYDIVRIKNREYRVNKIDYKSGELATVEFILI